MYECINCGKRAVGWKADYDFENFGYEGKGTVHIYRCSNCNAEIRREGMLQQLQIPLSVKGTYTTTGW